MDDHPVLLQLDSLRNALVTFQDEAHASAVKLQHHSLSTSRALDRVHALEHENTALNDELSTLRALSSSPSDLTSREIQINQLTLSLRTLNEKISTTEHLLAQRTQDLTNAFAELGKSRIATDAAYELASRIRGREEALKSHEEELRLKLRLAEERARMSERAVSEYADFVRALEGRRHTVGPYNDNGSSQTLVHPDDKEDNKGTTIEGLIREFAAEREDLQFQLSSTQHELSMTKSQHDAQTKVVESTLAELAQLRYKLQLLERDDTTAAKMVSRYMKFSQQSTNNLQTTLRTLTTRHTATLTSLTTHTHTLTHTLQSLESHNTRLLTSLDDIGGELLKESFGRRREVKVRMRLVRREERVLEGLRRWLRRSEERAGKVNEGDHHGRTDGDDNDARVWLNEMVQDAKILVDELDSPLHLTLTHHHHLPHTPDDRDDAPETPPTPVSGSLARLITIQSTINELVDELQREQSRRIHAEEALVRYQVQQEFEHLPEEEGQQQYDAEKEGTQSPSSPPPPLPPKNSRLPPSEHDDHVDPSPRPPLLPPPSETRVLRDTLPGPEPDELARVPTIILPPPPSEEEETMKTEEATIIPTAQSNLPIPPLLPPPDVVTLTVIPPTPTIIEDNERSSSLGVSVVVTDTEKAASAGDALTISDGIVEESDEARVKTEEDETESGPSSALPPSLESSGNGATPFNTDGLERSQERRGTEAVLTGNGEGLENVEITVDFSREKEMTTTPAPTALPNGDSITAEVVDAATREPENNQTQQQQQQDSDSEIDIQSSKQPPSPSTIEPSERESAQDIIGPPEAPEVSLAEEDSKYAQGRKEEDNTANDLLCTLEPPTIVVEPIPFPIAGAYAEIPNGIVDPVLSGRAVTAQHDGSISIPPPELNAAVTPISSSSLPMALPPPPPIPLSPPSPPSPPTPQHPLLHHLQKARTRYDHIQRAFHDCHIALESLKSSLLHPISTTIPPSSAQVTRTIPQDEWFKAIIQRLDDSTEDVRVELEIRILDEEVLGRGYEALLSVPGALDSHRHHEGEETLAEVEAQILAFVEGTEPGIQKALGGFQKKLEDLEHDIAVVKRAVHDSLQGISSSLDPSDPPVTSAVGGGGGWTSWIPGRAPSPTPPATTTAPTPTFGNIMTNRHRTPIRRTVSSLGLVDSNHHRAAATREEGGGGDIIKNLNLRIPMPDLSFVFPSSSSSLSHQDSSPSSSRGLGLGLGVGGAAPRSRTLSTMYMLGMGMGGMGGRKPAVSSPLQRRVVSAVPRFGDAPANGNGKEQLEEVDVD